MHTGGGRRADGLASTASGRLTPFSFNLARLIISGGKIMDIKVTCGSCRHLNRDKLRIPKAGFCNIKRLVKSEAKGAETCRSFSDVSWPVPKAGTDIPMHDNFVSPLTRFFTGRRSFR